MLFRAEGEGDLQVTPARYFLPRLDPPPSSTGVSGEGAANLIRPHINTPEGVEFSHSPLPGTFDPIATHVSLTVYLLCVACTSVIIAGSGKYSQFIA